MGGAYFHPGPSLGRIRTMSKVCVVGHVTSESIVVGGHRSGPTVGGTGFFSSFAYRKMGLDTTLVTKVTDNDRGILLS